MDQGLRSPGLCVFQSQHSREEGRRLRDVPRPRRRDAIDVSESVAPDEMVSRLPSQSGTVSSASRPDNKDGICAVGTPGGTRRAAGEGIPCSETGYVLDLPQMTCTRSNDR